MRLIVNADDFGYSKGVNLGIVEAYQHGIVTSASLMVNMPAMEHAVRLARLHPGLGVGIHLVLTCGRPVVDDVPSLVGGDGSFRRLPELMEHAREEEIEREWQAQMERFFASGLVPTHLDSHHHVHAHPRAWPIACRLAERYGIPLRRSIPRGAIEGGPARMTDVFFHDFYGEQATLETVERIAAAVGRGETAEMMCHPGFVDAPLLAGSSYALERARELDVLTHPRAREAIRRHGIRLITYREVSPKLG